MPIVTAATAEGATVLVLTRRVNESIMIGHEVVVTALEVRGDQVRLGIEAPRSVDVHREEIFKALHRANTEAAAVAWEASEEQIQDLDAALPTAPAKQE